MTATGSGTSADGAGSVGVPPAVALGGTAVPVGVPVAVPLAVPFVVPLADALGGVAVADPVLRRGGRRSAGCKKYRDAGPGSNCGP